MYWNNSRILRPFCQCKDRLFIRDLQIFHSNSHHTSLFCLIFWGFWANCAQKPRNICASTLSREDSADYFSAALLVHIWYHLAAILHYLCTFDTISSQFCTTCAHLIPSRHNTALLVHIWYNPRRKMVLPVHIWYHPHRKMVLAVHIWCHLATRWYCLWTNSTNTPKAPHSRCRAFGYRR